MKIPTDINVLSCGPKVSKHFGNFGRHFPALYPQKSSQRVRACAAHDVAICSKNREIVPYHRDSPNTSACLRSPSPIMAPGFKQTHMTHYMLAAQSGIKSASKSAKVFFRDFCFGMKLHFQLCCPQDRVSQQPHS